MIKTFNYKNILIRIKTNMLKDGKTYFGEKDVSDILQDAVQQVTYMGKTSFTKEQTILTLDQILRSKGIAPYEIIIEDLSYMGNKMTDFTNQRTI